MRGFIRPRCSPSSRLVGSIIYINMSGRQEPILRFSSRRRSTPSNQLYTFVLCILIIGHHPVEAFPALDHVPRRRSVVDDEHVVAVPADVVVLQSFAEGRFGE